MGLIADWLRKILQGTIQVSVETGETFVNVTNTLISIPFLVNQIMRSGTVAQTPVGDTYNHEIMRTGPHWTVITELGIREDPLSQVGHAHIRILDNNSNVLYWIRGTGLGGINGQYYEIVAINKPVIIPPNSIVQIRTMSGGAGTPHNYSYYFQYKEVYKWTQVKI